MKPVLEPVLSTRPGPVSGNVVLDRLNWRCSTKQFEPARRISPHDWEVLEASLVLTPSSYGLQPWKFIVVDAPEVRERLVQASYGQRQVADASHLVVFAVRRDLDAADVDRHVARTAEVRGVPVEKLAGFRQMLLGTVDRLTPAQRHEWNARQG